MAGDVRGFYQALGVELPGWARTEAPVRCFADPDAHAHADRDASCSVNVHSGAFNCHACGARGGAYDAALARGHTPRGAIDLMITFGLTERRPGGGPRAHRALARPAASPANVPAAESPRVALAVDVADVREWRQALQRSPDLLSRLEWERGWRREVLADLDAGFDGERITVPIWQPFGGRRPSDRLVLQGVLRLRVDRAQHPKVIAMPGTRLGLLPPPSWTGERRVLLVEGPSDMLAARSAGLPAVAVPGASAWRPEWAAVLSGRDVVVVMDCDHAGRHAARRIGEDLARCRTRVAVRDLDPARHDGYDLTDWLRAGNHPADLATASGRPAATSTHTAPARSASHAAAAASWTAGGGRSLGWRAF